MEATLGDKGVCDIITVDVEDWFHIPEVDEPPPLDHWETLTPRVEANFLKILELLAGAGVKATCFFLGWVARKFPNLVREAAKAGHEVASHGYAHQLVFNMTPDEFYRDVQDTKALIEDIVGVSIRAYRAPGFSFVRDTLWALDALVRAGYSCDSSIFPASASHGGIPDAPLGPHRIATASGELIEFPITLAKLFGRRVCFFGGGYLRLFPYIVIKTMAHQVHREGRPIVFYVHPREVDPLHPRLNMGMLGRFKAYVNLRSARGKLARILSDFHCTSMERWLQMYGAGDLPSLSYDLRKEPTHVIHDKI